MTSPTANKLDKKRKPQPIRRPELHTIGAKVAGMRILRIDREDGASVTSQRYRARYLCCGRVVTMGYHTFIGRVHKGNKRCVECGIEHMHNQRRPELRAFLPSHGVPDWAVPSHVSVGVHVRWEDRM